MKLAVGSDAVHHRSHLVQSVLEYLKEKGHDIKLFGDLVKPNTPWGIVGRQVAEAVASGRCEEGLVFCGTGTGVTIAANKVPGIRCSLCADRQDAMIARRYNHANIIAIGIFRTSEPRARLILDTWFTEKPITSDPAIESIKAIEKQEKDYFKTTI